MIVEVQFGEGGDDAKRFAHELAAMYVRYGALCGLDSEVLTEDDGHVVLLFKGEGVAEAFRHEPGLHCVQRVPANEARGRRHTSFAGVAVLPLPPADPAGDLPAHEVEVKTQPGRGPGGQHQNKTASAVRMTHKPTGLQVFINGREQHANRLQALRVLTARVRAFYKEHAGASYQADRRRQLGSGARGGKVRTYNLIDSRVVDHRLGVKTHKVKDVLRGRLELLLGGERTE